MEKTKEEIIADLYGLRAGLSLISQKIDICKEYLRIKNRYNEKIRECSNNKKEVEDQVRPEEQKLYQYQSEYNQVYQKYKSAKSELERRNKMSFSQKARLTSASKTGGKKFGEFFENLFSGFFDNFEYPEMIDGSWPSLPFLVVSFLAICVVTMVLVVVSPTSGCSGRGAFFGGGFLGILCAFAFCIPGAYILIAVFFVLYPIIYTVFKLVLKILKIIFGITVYPLFFPFMRRASMRQRSEQIRLEVEKIDQQFYDEVKRLENILNTTKYKVNVQSDRVEDWKKYENQNMQKYQSNTTSYQQKIEEIENALRSNVEEINMIKKSLHNTYDVWLSESDWENIDFIIYYLRTGRADSFKEALQLMDREKQTDRIVGAIEAANSAICAEVRGSMQHMAKALSESFAVISSQLSGVQMQLAVGNKYLSDIADSSNRIAYAANEAYKNIKSDLTKQIEAADLNNALLKKANETSIELVRDLRKTNTLLSGKSY